MREIFTEQVLSHSDEWTPAFHSPESIARVDLSRRLEVRLVPFTDEFGQDSYAHKLSTAGTTWGSGELEQAINELKGLLATTTSAVTPPA